MTITLFVAAALLIFMSGVTSVLQNLSSKVDVTVYMTTAATQDQIQQIETSLQALPQVQSVTYISADQALAAFQARHANDQLTMQALQELPESVGRIAASASQRHLAVRDDRTIPNRTTKQRQRRQLRDRQGQLYAK